MMRSTIARSSDSVRRSYSVEKAIDGTRTPSLTGCSRTAMRSDCIVGPVPEASRLRIRNQVHNCAVELDLARLGNQQVFLGNSRAQASKSAEPGGHIRCP